MTGVRYREDIGFEGRCDYCREYWPLTTEFWQVSKRSMRMCRACLREYHRLAQQKRRTDPEKRERDRLGVYEMREALKRHGLMGEYRRRWYLTNRERLCADRRERYRQQRLASGKPYTPRGADSDYVRRKAA